MAIPLLRTLRDPLLRPLRDPYLEKRFSRLDAELETRFSLSFRQTLIRISLCIVVILLNLQWKLSRIITFMTHLAVMHLSAMLLQKILFFPSHQILLISLS